MVRGFSLGLLLALLAAGAGAAELTLDAAVHRALANNREHLGRLDDVTLAELDYDQVRSAYRTQFRASGNSNAINGAELGSYYGVGVFRDTVSGSRYAAGVYNSSYGERSLSELRFSYTLPFFNEGRKQSNELRLDRAESTVLRRERMVAIAEEELTAEVTETYFHVVLARERAAMLEGQLAITEAAMERARIRRDAGEVAALQYDRAELRRHRAEQALLQARFQQRMAEDRLKLLLAMDVAEIVEPITPIAVEDSFALLDAPVAHLEEIALNQRQEVLGQREELSLSSRRFDTLGDSVFPDIDVDIHYSLIGEGNRFDDSLQFDDQRWGVSVRMDTDFGAIERRNQRSRTFIHLQKLRRELDAQEQKIRVEVRSKRFELERAIQSLTIAEASLSLSSRAHEQTELLVDRGELSELDRLESELEHAEAAYQVQAARVDLLIAASALELALGGP